VISQTIVFVVGAGASSEYGLPAGAQMKEKIASSLNFNRDTNGLLIGDKQLFEIVGFKFKAESQKYFDGAIELSLRIGEFESIDEALHWFSARNEIVSLGKIAIVREILRAERASSLFNQNDPATILPTTSYADTWLPLFLSLAVGSLRKEEAATAFRNVTVINFNYDRTIEHFLYSRLQTNFGLDAQKAKAVLSGLNIIRPYGSVGLLPWQDESGIPFGAQTPVEYDALHLLSQNVRTFTEQNLSNDLRLAITAAIDNSRVVVFLGFGFHQQNMSLLRAVKHVQWRRVLATVLNIDAENYDTLKGHIASVVGAPQEIAQLLPRYSHIMLRTLKPTLLAVLN